jgi:hypothetical protein
MKTNDVASVVLFVDMRKKTNLVIFKAGKKVRSKITLVAASTICPHGVPPGMFSIVILEISTESFKCFKSIPDTEIIYLYVF